MMALQEGEILCRKYMVLSGLQKAFLPKESWLHVQTGVSGWGDSVNPTSQSGR